MSYTRQMLERWFPNDKRMQKAMESQRDTISLSETGLKTTAQATELIEQASVLVLASNNAFTNERVLVLDSSLSGNDDGKNIIIKTSAVVPLITGGFTVSIAAFGNSQFSVPLNGKLATVGNVETLTNKTIQSPKFTGMGNYVDDAAASAGGVPINGAYHNAGAVRFRLI